MGLNIEEPAPDFAGLRVFAFESRMAAETASLIERFGGRATVVPAMREVPLQDNYAAFEFAARLLSGQIDLAIFLTGVGVRELFRMTDIRYPREQIVKAINAVVTVARGPKPLAALRELGIEAKITIPEPNTWREILSSVGEFMQLEGKRVAVQEYGVSNRDLIAGLEARGALVFPVPVYRWALPEERGPLCAAAGAIAKHEADVVLFTSSAQVTNLIQLADAAGVGAEMRRRAREIVVGSIGPVCSQELRAHGIEPDFEPAHPKLGHLIKEAAARSAKILRQKRSQNVEIVEVGRQRDAALAKSDASSLSTHPLMRACRRESAPYTPIWLMRQAGRYLPQYKLVRDRHPFLEMCRQPDLAAEVTLTAFERLGVDAAIIFADILLPLLPMDVGLRYEAGDGPIIEQPIRAEADLRKLLAAPVAESLGFVAAAIKIVRRALSNRTPLIGFAGAPFTLASYLVEGGSSRQYQATKTLMYNSPAVWHQMMELLARTSAEYLRLQIEAGADVVQLFDSWVGSLSPDDYRRFVLPYTRHVISAMPAGVPVIHFGTVTSALLELMRGAGGDVIGLDWRVDLGEAWHRLGSEVGVQGNLDPVALFADIPEIKRRAGEILEQAGGRPGHIFNLGHGILPETPVDHVIALVDMVHEMSAR
ncbi:MAG: uroporphyrinogen decarboxylase [Deltaproteobacteria bacterium]|nr:uroporphyrinogen decarboxylase [Deltaproteobacteria bacterium]